MRETEEWIKKKINPGTCEHLICDKAFFFFFFFGLFRATLVVYGSSQARGQIRALAAGVCQHHSNAGSEPHLQPTPQLRATPDP